MTDRLAPGSDPAVGSDRGEVAKLLFAVVAPSRPSRGSRAESKARRRTVT